MRGAAAVMTALEQWCGVAVARPEAARDCAGLWIGVKQARKQRPCHAWPADCTLSRFVDHRAASVCKILAHSRSHRRRPKSVSERSLNSETTATATIKINLNHKRLHSRSSVRRKSSVSRVPEPEDPPGDLRRRARAEAPLDSARRRRRRVRAAAREERPEPNQFLAKVPRDNQ